MNTRWAKVGLVLCYLGALGVVARTWLIIRMGSSELESMAHDMAYTVLLSAALVFVGASITLIALLWARPQTKKA